MICNKILGKVTKFGEKQTKTVGVPPPPPLGLYRVNNIMPCAGKHVNDNMLCAGKHVNDNMLYA